MTLYRRLKTLAASNPHLLLAYRTDLTDHDRRAIRSMKVGQTWLWILRPHGTLLFPAGAGQHPG